MRVRKLSISLVALATMAMAVGSPVLGATATEVQFSFTGAEQSFDVPIGVTTVHVVLVGGRGYDTGGGSDPAQVEGDLLVTPGTRLYVEVGGDGGAGGTDPGAGVGGFNGGGDGGVGSTFGPASAAGGGGGASDIRTQPRGNVASLDTRLAVAAGGGGAGFNALGGDAGSAGSGGSSGGAGTLAAGGAGGTASVDGMPGSFGTGGNGGSSTSGAAGGGGGGGYYGGGGGGGGFTGGGGGGGSSYTGGLSVSLTTQTIPNSTPSVTISYEGGSLGSPDGLVDATVTMASSAVCLELSTTSIDFGTRRFGDVQQAATPLLGVTNCSQIGETILAHGTNATGIGPVNWTLVDTGSCTGATLPTDSYRLTLRNGPSTDVALSSADKTVGTLVAGDSATDTALIDTPCPGSSGAGVQVAMQIVFVATE